MEIHILQIERAPRYYESMGFSTNDIIKYMEILGILPSELEDFFKLCLKLYLLSIFTIK